MARNAGRAKGVVESAEARMRDMQRRAYMASSEYREYAAQALQQRSTSTKSSHSTKRPTSKGGAKRGTKPTVASNWLARGRAAPPTTKGPSSPAQPADPRVVEAGRKSLKVIGSLG